MPRREHGVRVDTGVRAGDAISPYYDPMIAKLIVHGRTRSEALSRMGRALAQVEVAGCITNAGFLSRLIALDSFVRGDLDTGLIPREMTNLLRGEEADPDLLLVAALHALGALDMPDSVDPWDTLRGWRAFSGARQFAHLQYRDEVLEIPVSFEGDGCCTVEMPGAPVHVSSMRRDDDLVVLDLDTRLLRAAVVPEERGVHVLRGGLSQFFGLPDRSSAEDDSEDTVVQVSAPLPGRVVSVAVAPGDVVDRGTELLVIEAMKMETSIRAPRAGTIAEVGVAVGEQVDDATVLVSYEQQDEGA